MFRKEDVLKTVVKNLDRYIKFSDLFTTLSSCKWASNSYFLSNIYCDLKLLARRTSFSCGLNIIYLFSQILLQLLERYFSKRGLVLVILLHKTAAARGNPCFSPDYYSCLPENIETLTWLFHRAHYYTNSVVRLAPDPYGAQAQQFNHRAATLHELP